MNETSAIQVRTDYSPVRLPKELDFGIAIINGREVPVTEEYLNSAEARSFLEQQRIQIHKGTLAFLDIVDYLDRIAESKVYLCLADANGEPLYSTWESFLKGETSLDRHSLSKMRSARDGYRWLEQAYGSENGSFLTQLPSNMNFYYQLEQIPEEQRETALNAVWDGRNGNTPTAQALEQWRKDAKALSAHKKTEIVKKEQPAEQEKALADDTSAPQVDAPAQPACETLSPETSVPPSKVYVRDATLEDLTDGDATSGNSSIIEQVELMPPYTRNNEETVPFEDSAKWLVSLLENREFQKWVGEEAIGHSDRGDLKPGETTVRSRIDDAISTFKKGVNGAQLDYRRHAGHSGKDLN